VEARKVAAGAAPAAPIANLRNDLGEFKEIALVISNSQSNSHLETLSLCLKLTTREWQGCSKQSRTLRSGLSRAERKFLRSLKRN